MRRIRRQRLPYRVLLRESLPFSPAARPTWRGDIWDTRAACLVGGTGDCATPDEAWAWCLVWLNDHNEAAPLAADGRRT